MKITARPCPVGLGLGDTFTSIPRSALVVRRRSDGCHERRGSHGKLPFFLYAGCRSQRQPSAGLAKRGKPGHHPLDGRVGCGHRRCYGNAAGIGSDAPLSTSCRKRWCAGSSSTTPARRAYDGIQYLCGSSRGRVTSTARPMASTAGKPRGSRERQGQAGGIRATLGSATSLLPRAVDCLKSRSGQPGPNCTGVQQTHCASVRRGRVSAPDR